MESIIYKIIRAYVEKLGLLPNSQHHFRAEKSVTTQLLETYNDLTNALENQNTVTVIYFDLVKLSILLTILNL